MGAFAPVAPRLAAAVPDRARCWSRCALLTAAGRGLRGLGGTAALFAGALWPGVAIALAQALLPVLIRATLPVAAGVLTGAFSMALLARRQRWRPAPRSRWRTLARRMASRRWRSWALPALIAALVWLPAAMRPGTHRDDARRRGSRCGAPRWRGRSACSSASSRWPSTRRCRGSRRSWRTPGCSTETAGALLAFGALVQPADGAPGRRSSPRGRATRSALLRRDHVPRRRG